jgi:UDP:flavonoid glycosyltransferase YjiC (YdhE family)
VSDYLFALWDGGGAVPPVLSVAGALAARGHRVRVLADPVLADEVEAAGVAFVPWRVAPHRTDRDPANDPVKDWQARSPMAAFARLRDQLMFGPAELFARDLLNEHARQPAHAVVAEMLMPGAFLGAQAAGLPSAALVTTINPLPTPGRPPFGPGFAPARTSLGRVRDRVVAGLGRRSWDRGLPTLNEARATLGLAPLEHALDQVAGADRVLVLSSAAFDAPLGEPAPNVRYTGPRLDDPPWVADWTPPGGEDPLVLVGLSSTFMDQAALLGGVAQALGSLPVRGLITTGPAIDPASVAAPAGVTVVASAPHARILPHAAAAVTHGGHGTVIKALAAGVPLVVAPLGRDQLDVAQRVVGAGAGIRLKPGAKPEKLAAAIREVVEDPSYRVAAERLAAAIADETAEDRAVADLESLVRQSAAGGS